MAKWMTIGLLLFFGPFEIQGPVHAEVPSPLLNFQGTVGHAETGDPLSGTVSIRFSLYKKAVGGEPIWEEVQTVQVEGGRYHVLLGSASPFSDYPGGVKALFSEPRWLETYIFGEEHPRPRRLIEGSISLTGKKENSCPEDMVDLGEFCMDRHQNTNGLTWYGAGDFCFLQGKRLCSISEWLEACDGSPVNGVYDMPGRQSNWVDQWVYETSTEVFNAVDRGFFRCSSFSRPWDQYRPLEKKWFRCCK